MYYPYRKFSPLKTIDFVKIGLGDNLMAWAGLYALLKYGYQVCAPGCKMYVPHALAPLGMKIFSEWDLQVVGASFDDTVEYLSPVLTPLAPTTVRQFLDVYMGDDWWLNWAEAIDRVKTDSYYHQRRMSFKQKVRLQVSETVLHGRIDWRSAYPDYIGSRIWSPIARRHDIPQAKFLVMLKNTLDPMREAVRAYARGIALENAPAYLAFPAGKSYQTLPPSFCRAIDDEVPNADFTYIVPPGDAWMDGYVSAGLTVSQLESVDEILASVMRARVVLTADSFVSHAAQFLRDDFILLLSRDFRENVVHPGAYPRIIAKHPDCAPCEYHSREFYQKCPAGFSHCTAFDDSAVLGRCVNELQTLLLRSA